ncbi:unnamed protein product [Echinostoma caproni]|uniref:Lipoma HMGIC fusion partner-like 2 protein n=1 Tax=Echinostoma caproni TaxID=27848 RepID=A0A183B1I5_9TREM|nr:unnamed protein product [Echinostoma caproni]
MLILVLLVPFHFLPLLLEFGGMECHTNPLWCPEGPPSASERSWLTPLLTWPADWTAFVSPGAILLTIGLSGIVGRLLAAMYIEKGVGTGCRAFQRCPCVGDPLILNNVLLVLCAISLACFPLAIHGVILTPSRTDRDDFERYGAVVTGENGRPEQIQAWSVEFRLMLFFIASVIYGVACGKFNLLSS